MPCTERSRLASGCTRLPSFPNNRPKALRPCLNLQPESRCPVSCPSVKIYLG